MNPSVISCQGWWTARKPLREAGFGIELARRQRSLRQPPKQRESIDDSNQTVEEEHPLEAHKAASAVHLLETSGHETHHCSGDLGGGEVHPNTFAGARGWIEERKVVGHTWPHTSNDDTEQQAEKTDSISYCLRK